MTQWLVKGSVDADRSLRSLEPNGDDPRILRFDPVDFNVVEGVILRLAEPGTDDLRIAGDFKPTDRHRSGSCGWVLAGVAAPLDEEWQLGVGHDVENAELLPIEVVSVGAYAVARPSFTTKSRLQW